MRRAADLRSCAEKGLRLDHLRLVGRPGGSRAGGRVEGAPKPRGLWARRICPDQGRIDRLRWRELACRPEFEVRGRAAGHQGRESRGFPQPFPTAKRLANPRQLGWFNGSPQDVRLASRCASGCRMARRRRAGLPSAARRLARRQQVFPRVLIGRVGVVGGSNSQASLSRRLQRISGPRRVGLPCRERVVLSVAAGSSQPRVHVVFSAACRPFSSPHAGRSHRRVQAVLSVACRPFSSPRASRSWRRERVALSVACESFLAS